MVVYEVCGWPSSWSMTSQYHGLTGIRVRLWVQYQQKTGSLDVNGCQCIIKNQPTLLAGKASQRTRGCSLHSMT
jgi:hypothetical protein